MHEHKIIKTALILAGGSGTHFENRDKALVKFDGKAIIGYVLDSLKGVGIEDVVVITNETSKDEIEELVKPNFLNYSILNQPPDSFRKTIKLAKDFLPNEFLVVVGNQPLEKQHLGRMLTLFQKSGSWVVSLYNEKHSAENVLVSINRDLNLYAGDDFVLQHPFVIDKSILNYQEKEKFAHTIEKTIRFASMENEVKGVLTTIPPEFDDLIMLEKNIVYLKIMELD